MTTSAHQVQSDLIYSNHTISAYTTANQHQPCQPMHIRDNLTSSTVTVPYQPMSQPISTNHANLWTSGTIWHHLISSFPLSLECSQSEPTMSTYIHQRQSDLIYNHHTISAYATVDQYLSFQPMHKRDTLTSLNNIIPTQPRLQPISTNHANQRTSGNIRHHLISSFPLSLDYSRSMSTYVNHQISLILTTQ